MTALSSDSFPHLLEIPFQALATANPDDLRQLLLQLLCQVAYQEGDFILSSGQHSTYYINGKLVSLHPQGAWLIGRLMLSYLPGEIKAVAGLTLGADPLVTAVSMVAARDDRLLFPLIVRKAAKGHGTQAYIEGMAMAEGTPVAVLEDVVTTGQSALIAVNRLRAAGYQVGRIVALVDRQQGGADLYRQQGLTFEALFSIQDLQGYPPS
ncbi:Orotate phosphoribosyltransferase [Halomicronema hongdechloris C2206]|uniref:Orotate phosphoribosyltransferase n=1 Tax=Halomicronema hongdechloris C2206 TaxID=1641165 RepID=A0A1Z3HIT4_9CYAN|nr:orotate phosphoribosyltransferase [Halomicronema hongdechloris]ASC70232.1 Orotate phosphoribosyltransferase [Halomicronema hongdechloris C2206]